jgi:hypothetical protein
MCDNYGIHRSAAISTPASPLPRLFHNHPRTICLVLTVACLVAAFAVVNVGRPSVGKVTVSYPDNPDLKPGGIDLPFQGGPMDKVTRFLIDANVTLSPFSSSILRISPDECMESITVNGGKPHELSKLDEDKRCWPNSYDFDGGDELRRGENTIRIEIKNKEGPYGVERIKPMLTQNAALLVATLVWAALCASLYLGFGRESRVAIRGTAARQLVRYSLSALGLFMIAGQLINDRDVFSLKAPAFVLFAAVAVQAVLLLRILDKVRENPIRLRWSTGWAVVCVVAFVAVSLKSLTGYDQIERFSLTVLGMVAGMFAVTPVFATLHRARRVPTAVAIAALAAAMPLAYTLPINYQLDGM